MMRTFMQALVACCLLLYVQVCVQGSPIEAQQETTTTATMESYSSAYDTLTNKMFKSFGEVTIFLRSWLRRLRDQTTSIGNYEHQATSMGSQEQQATSVGSETNQEQVARQRRSANQTDGPAFEDYEKTYLVKQTMLYLRQMYELAEYQKAAKLNDTDVTSDADADNTTSVDPMMSTTPSVTETTEDGNRVSSVLLEKRRQLEALSLNELQAIYLNVHHAAKNGIEDISESTLSSLCCPY